MLIACVIWFCSILYAVESIDLASGLCTICDWESFDMRELSRFLDILLCSGYLHIWIQ